MIRSLGFFRYFSSRNLSLFELRSANSWGLTRRTVARRAGGCNPVHFLQENLDRIVNFSDKTPFMKKLTLSILFLTALVGLHVGAPMSIAIGEPDDADEVVSDGIDDDDDEALAATQEQDAAAGTDSAAASNLGTILIGPSSSGEAVRILSTGYTLQPLSGCSPIDPRCNADPIIVGAADLFTPWIIDRLKTAYEAGHAVGVTNATVTSLQRLHDLLQHHGSVQPVPGGTTIDLVAFRKAQRSDGQFHFSSHLLLARATPDTPHLSKKAKKQFKRLPKKAKRELRRLARQQQRPQRLADSNDIRALSRIFSATPEVPEQPPLGGSPQQNLITLAESYESHGIQSDSYGNQVQLVDTIWAARSFTNSADLYYVLQENDYHIVPVITSKGIPFFLTSWDNTVQSLLSGSPTLIQPSPQTTMEATVDTSSVSHTIGGSVGWNQTQGLNASVSASTTITNSKTTTIPPINITNDANFVTGGTVWTYNVNELPRQAESVDLFSQWIWQVPFSNYTASQKELFFGSQANLKGQWKFIIPFDFRPIKVNLQVNILPTVPLPFGRTFALQPPAVTSVSPGSVNQGDTFTINGTGFYPSLVTAVLIGGTPLSQDNVTPVSDTKLTVVAPAFFACELGCSVVVQTTQGTSNDDITISIIP